MFKSHFLKFVLLLLSIRTNKMHRFAVERRIAANMFYQKSIQAGFYHIGKPRVAPVFPNKPAERGKKAVSQWFFVNTFINLFFSEAESIIEFLAQIFRQRMIQEGSQKRFTHLGS